MLALKEEGKVRAVGVSNFDIGLLERCEALGHVDSLQPPFSLIGRDTAGELLPGLASTAPACICYSPMKNGLLTDSFGAGADRAHGRGRLAPLGPQLPASRRWAATSRCATPCRPVAERHGATVAAVAVAWVLAWPGVSGAIVGARAPEQVDGWVGAAELTLSDADLDEIAAPSRSPARAPGPPTRAPEARSPGQRTRCPCGCRPRQSSNVR